MATEDRTRRLEEIFSAALQSDPGERAEFVRNACGPDEDLRKEIESLLGWEAEASTFLQEPAFAGGVTDAQLAPQTLVGRALGPYTVVSLLGAGGMGEVYAARDTRLGRLVALKILPESLADDERLKRRLLQEARAVSALNHRGIVTLHDVGRDGELDFLVMEYVAGETLDKLIPPDGLEVKKALRYGVEITDALAAAHEAGIVHRDLKPGNIMVTSEGVVKVLDFGLAKLDEPLPSTQTASALTEAGVIAGTAAYMSPEQTEGKAIDARSDIFSFGVVLYEMLTGVQPFRRPDRAATFAAILTERPPRLRALRRGISKPLEQIVQHCLSKDPAERFQKSAELHASLEKEFRRPGAKMLGLWFAAAALVLSLSGFFAYQIENRSQLGHAHQNVGKSNGLLAKESPLTSDRGIQSWPTLSPRGDQVAFS